MSQRAYTLQLDDVKKDDDSWRRRLWTTHAKINAGARAFGDFLLTLRGGLPAPHQSDQKSDQTIARRLSALCWFSAESETPETLAYCVPTLGGPKGRRAKDTEMRMALEECLRAKDVTDIDTWVKDCLPSLQATIRDDAVWVQRWRMFDALQQQPEPNDIRAIFDRLLGKGWAAGSADDAGTPDKDTSQQVVKAARSIFGDWLGEGRKTDFSKLKTAYRGLQHMADQIASSPQATIPEIKERVLAFIGGTPLEVKCKKGKLTGIIDPRFKNPGPSKGKKAKEFWQEALLLVRADSKGVIPDPQAAAKLLNTDYWRDVETSAKRWLDGQKTSSSQEDHSWCPPLKERFEREAGLRIADGSGGPANTEFARLMLAAAAVRLSQTQSWIKRKELERLEAEKVVAEKSAKFKPDGGSEAARRWLDDFLERRARNSGALDAAIISKNALDGWKSVVKRWKTCATMEDRLRAVRESQEHEEKFGDASLFQALADEDAACVWKPDGKNPDASVLEDYSKHQRAQAYVRRHKVPSFRHPDPFLHPVFCEFGNSRPRVRYGWQDNLKDRSRWHDLELLLLDEDGKATTETARWRCDRLNRELGLGSGKPDGMTNLSRNTRLGRQAAGQFPDGRLDDAIPASLLSDKDLNARLQADRDDLARLGKQFGGDSAKASQAASRLPWFVTFSPELTPAGPWLDFAAKPEIAERLTKDNAPVWYSRRNNDWIVNLKTGWLVRPGLGTLPRMRVLGVDLGHRYGAVGAIWQQVSIDDIREECGRTPPADKVWFRCDDAKRGVCLIGRKKGKKPELVFRRIGEQSWARLERQFIIRLPGELDDRRGLRDWEQGWIDSFIEVGEKPEPEGEKGDAVSARLALLRQCQRALANHGDRIRIFHYLAASRIPGAGGVEHEVASPQQRQPHVEKALRLWEKLAARRQGTERRLWDEWVVKRQPGLAMQDEEAARENAQQRQDLRRPLAGELANQPSELGKIAEAFKNFWKEEDLLWPKRLKGLSHWIAGGRRLNEEGQWVAGKAADRSGIGGLSLDRIASLELLARLQRAYAQRPTASRLWNESREGGRPGRAIRDKMERLREDRLKKLANAVAMAAMGLVAKDSFNGKGNDKSRKVENDRHRGDRFKPVQAVAIENLENYRPEVSRTRRENRGLMSWSARELARRLGDACRLHGLLLVQVQPNYTSRLCSRCAAPGVRCEPVRWVQSKQQRFWTRELSRAAKVKEEKPQELTSLQSYLLELSSAELKNDDLTLIPRNGGALFVCSAGCCGNGWIQADLNAAANVGLRALMDGRWEGAWQYIPTKKGKADAKANSLKGMPNALATATMAPKENLLNKSIDSTYNSFRDLSRGIPADIADWKPYKPFFAEAEKAVIERLLSALKKT